MADEKILKDEVLSDEELDGVAGGTKAQTDYDKSFFASIGMKGDLGGLYKNYGIGFSANAKDGNVYTCLGHEINQFLAQNVVSLQTKGYKLDKISVRADGSNVIELISTNPNNRGSTVYVRI